jgi:nitroimidazol reductase NimA-like FMN-containing flavoprotein (pyridoxamine 5'-phosphate oxidase superfamily)
MRRKDREMPEEFAWELADRCRWMVLSMTDPQGDPYCVPLSMAREGRTFYFHCARDGEKIQCLRACPQVCISCVGEVRPVPEEYALDYESAVFRGIAREVTEEKERFHALELICRRYAPSNPGGFDGAVERSFSRTAIWKVEVASAAGKRRPGPSGK